MIKINLQNKKGFTILVAVIVSALVLSIGLSVANITVKQITLSSAGRDSQIAFYVADSAAECALYNDLIGKKFPNTDDVPKYLPVTCFGETVIPANVTESSGTYSGSLKFASTTIKFTSTGHWSEVQVGKYEQPDGSIKTIISALGYNANPAVANKRLIERGLEITY